ncbi:hypothetical protein EV421DRAFT_543508 [Armillaria borealis]|uniref:Uncharacterized protein n=1 Tax=Armillaria borealis TaxID=47425 RepID=A0AA39MQW0_9AGAR|nr:hypothetical protein EV421DRAFT_543508 [Armillaria borealis]
MTSCYFRRIPIYMTSPMLAIYVIQRCLNARHHIAFHPASFIQAAFILIIRERRKTFMKGERQYQRSGYIAVTHGFAAQIILAARSQENFRL